MSKLKEQFKDLSKNGIGGMLLAGLLILILFCLLLVFVACIMGLAWALGGAVIYYGMSLVGYPIAYKVAYGASMLLSVLSGVIGGVKINQTSKS